MKKLSLILLILGLLFSQLIVMIYNLNDGFEFHKIIIRFYPLAKYSTISPDLKLKSVLVGYIFFVIFGVLNTNKTKSPETFKSALMFTGIVVVLSFFEFTSILEDINGTFRGKHFEIGWIIFLLGLWIFSKRYISKK